MNVAFTICICKNAVWTKCQTEQIWIVYLFFWLFSLFGSLKENTNLSEKSEKQNIIQRPGYRIHPGSGIIPMQSSRHLLFYVESFNSVVTVCKTAWHSIMAPGWKAMRAQSVVYGATAPLRSHKGCAKTKRWNVGGRAMNSERPRPPLNLRRVVLFLFLFISLRFAIMWYPLQLHEGRNARPLRYSRNLWSGDGQGGGLHTRTTFEFLLFFLTVPTKMIWVRRYKCQAFPHEDGHDWGPSGLMWGSCPSRQLCLYLSDFLIQTIRTVNCWPLRVSNTAGSNRCSSRRRPY